MSTAVITGTTAGRPRARQGPPELGGLGLAAVLTSYALQVLNFFVVTVALGSLESELRASPSVLELVVAGFGVAYASTVVLGGRLGDNVGRRRVLRVGLVWFGAASVWCALAPSAGLLVAGRVAQGLGASLVAPQVLSTIQARTEGASRARAMAWFGAMAGIATCVAFIVGGALVTADPGGLGWRAAFWLDIPLVLAALVAQRWVPESRAERPQRVDAVGTALLSVAVVLVILPLTEGRAAGWPWWTWAMLASCVPVLGALARWEWRMERRGRDALVPPSLLRTRSMVTGLTMTAIFFTVFGGFMFVFALAAEVAAGMDPLDIGWTLTPFALSFLGASLVGSRAAQRDPVGLMERGAVIAAVALAALGLVLLATWPGFTSWQLALPLVVLGVGQGMLVVPLFGTVLGGVPAHHAGMGGGVLITTMQMALGLGSALVGTVFLELGGATGNAAPVEVVLAASVVLVLVTALVAGRLRTPPAEQSGQSTSETLAA
ncbi:MAG: MFS transporter [Nocardioides sp.]|nr:MFS transporter [Nocardioides sp.]